MVAEVSVGSLGGGQILCEMEFVQLFLFKNRMLIANLGEKMTDFLKSIFPGLMAWTISDNGHLVSSTKAAQAAKMLCVSLYLLQFELFLRNNSSKRKIFFVSSKADG